MWHLVLSVSFFTTYIYQYYNIMLLRGRSAHVIIIKNDGFLTVLFPRGASITFFWWFYFALWPLCVAVPSRNHHSGAVETCAPGIQHGSGGTERVIGLRYTVLLPDWIEKCENEEDERRESGDPPAAQPLQSPLTVPVLHTHTEDWDVTVYRRNTACFCGIFFCQTDDGRGEAGSHFGHADHLGCGASWCDYLGVRSGR